MQSMLSRVNRAPEEVQRLPQICSPGVAVPTVTFLCHAMVKGAGVVITCGDAINACENGQQQGTYRGFDAFLSHAAVQGVGKRLHKQ